MRFAEMLKGIAVVKVRFLLEMGLEMFRAPRAVLETRCRAKKNGLEAKRSFDSRRWERSRARHSSRSHGARRLEVDDGRRKKKAGAREGRGGEESGGARR